MVGASIVMRSARVITYLKILVTVTFPMVCGTYRRERGSDCGLGHEGLGMIDAKGASATLVKVGESRMVCFSMPSMAENVHFTEPTTDYWQNITPPDSEVSIPSSPYRYSYPSLLPNDSYLNLPIRPLNTNPNQAVASLLVSHASFAVSEELEIHLANLLRPLDFDVVVGLPTLGLGPAASVARKLGHARYVPLGYSRKFWYTDALSTLLSSITSPLGEKRVFLDPNLLPLIKGKKIAIIDDAVSSGKTMNAIWDLLESEEIACDVVACGVLMKQGQKWAHVLGPSRSSRVVGVFESPLLQAVDGGWVLREEQG